jgi:hypothetical protein
VLAIYLHTSGRIVNCSLFQYRLFRQWNDGNRTVLNHLALCSVYTPNVTLALVTKISVSLSLPRNLKFFFVSRRENMLRIPCILEAKTTLLVTSVLKIHSVRETGQQSDESCITEQVCYRAKPGRGNQIIIICIYTSQYLFHKNYFKKIIVD